MDIAALTTIIRGAIASGDLTSPTVPSINDDMTLASQDYLRWIQTVRAYVRDTADGKASVEKMLTMRGIAELIGLTKTTIIMSYIDSQPTMAYASTMLKDIAGGGVNVAHADASAIVSSFVNLDGIEQADVDKILEGTTRTKKLWERFGRVPDVLEVHLAAKGIA